MPRRKEPTFELKTIIWNVASKVGKDNLQAIQRQVDYEIGKRRLEESKEVEIFEDTPDTRTIKRIINEDINELPPEVVVSELPRHIWRLRDDCETLTEFAIKRGLHIPSEAQLKSVLQGESEEIVAAVSSDQSDRAIEHDKIIFNESDNIMNENEVRKYISTLDFDVTFDESQHYKLIDFLEYFSFESNKYQNEDLQYLCDKMYDTLDKLYGLAKFRVTSAKLDELEKDGLTKFRATSAKLDELEKEGITPSIELQSIFSRSKNKHELQPTQWERKDRERRKRKYTKKYTNLKDQLKPLAWQNYLDYRIAIRKNLSL